MTANYSNLDPRPTEINGPIGYVVTRYGYLKNVVVFDIAEGLVEAIRVTRNPDKLRRLEGLV